MVEWFELKDWMDWMAALSSCNTCYVAILWVMQLSLSTPSNWYLVTY
jgi:hypothetical protein